MLCTHIHRTAYTPASKMGGVHRTLSILDAGIECTTLHCTQFAPRNVN